ncbi:MAG: cytochrome c oxidase subunit 3 [Acidimicrobiia bacterium]
MLGVSFLVGQLVVWQQLVTAGVYVPTSPHASFFYILTGLHGVHLLAGLILLLYTVGHIGNVKGHGDALDWRALMALSATFWHFFGVLWLYLFAMLAVA